jgi:large subunit ribosomal protein L35
LTRAADCSTAASLAPVRKDEWCPDELVLQIEVAGQKFEQKIMPKMKTHSGAAKRFKKTGTGKIKRAMAYKRHILTSKDTKRKRQLGGTTMVSDADHAKVARMIPY